MEQSDPIPADCLLSASDIEEITSGWTRSGRNALVIWSHPTHGRFADGLFRLHDEQGFSLTDSLIACRQHGLKPCLGQFRADALGGGWTRSKVDMVVAAAIADAASMSLANNQTCQT